MLTPILVVLAASNQAAQPQTSLPSRAVVFTVSKDGTATAASDKAEAQLTQALTDANVPVADVGSLFPTPPEPTTGARLMKEGLEAFDNLDTDVAGKKYQEALSYLEQNPAAADTKSLAEIHLFLGNIALQSGKSGKKKGAEEIARAAALDHSFELNPKYFGPDVKKEWEKTVKELDGKAKHKLTFSSTPAGAEVFFRNKRVGTTPMNDGISVAPGRHLVTMKRAGFDLGGVLVDVSADAEAKVTLKPVGAYGAQRTKMIEVLPGNFGGKQVPNAATGVAEAMKSRFLVVAEVDGKGDGRLEVWDVAQGNRLKDVTLVAGSYSSAAEQVKRFVSNPSPLAGGTDAPVASVEASSSDSEPLTKKWWFWAAVGGAVVVAAGVTTGVVVANQPQNTWSPILF